MKEPEVPSSSPFAPVIALGSVQIAMLLKSIRPDDQSDTAHYVRERVAGMESVLTLCRRAAAGEKLDAPMLVKVERKAAPTTTDRSLEERVEELELRVTQLEGPRSVPDPPPPRRAVPEILKTPKSSRAVKSKGGLSGCAVKCLGVLKQRREQPTTVVQLAIFAGYSATSGGLGQALADLRAGDFIAGSGSDMRITRAGLDIAPDVEELPKGNALAQYWIARLKGAQRRVFEAVWSCARAGLDSVDQLASVTGYSATSGGLGQAIADLRKMELITSSWPMRAADTFFERGSR
jgi:hypothetical protein